MTVAVRFFEAANREGLRYAQFKSVGRLDRSFAGETDFDLLVHPSDAERMIALAEAHGFRQRLTNDPRASPEIVDLIAYDADQDAIHHLSVHRRLVFGERGLKNHCFDNVETILAQCEPHETWPVRIVPPPFELLLLCLRVALKTRPSRRWIRSLVSQGPGAWLPELSMAGELDELIARVDPGELRRWTADLVPGLGPSIAWFVSAYRDGRLGPSSMLRFRRQVRRGLRQHQILPSLAARLRRIRFRSARSSRPIRSLATSGRIIAVVGADGAGKSTVVRDLHEWLSYKLSSVSLYLGIPKGHPIPRGLRRLASLFARLRLRRLAEAALEWRHVAHAYLRHRLVRRAAAVREQGIIVLTDRYPLRAFWSMTEPMDGPRLSQASPRRRRERSLYERLPAQPDLVVALAVDLETAAQRKPFTSPTQQQQVASKIDAVRRLAEQGCEQPVVVLHPHGPYNDVLREAKRAVWALLAGPA